MVERLLSVHRESIAAAGPLERVRSPIAAVALQINRRPADFSSISGQEKVCRCHPKPSGPIDFLRHPPGDFPRLLSVGRCPSLGERMRVRLSPGCKEAVFPAACASNEFSQSGLAQHPSDIAEALFFRLRSGPVKQSADRLAG